MVSKRGVMLVSLVVLMLFFVSSCGVNSNFELSDVWKGILDLGKLTFLQGENLEGFLRLMIAILVFALFFEASRLLPMQPNIRAVVAIILSIISVIAIPKTVLVALAATYATLVSFVLIGTPVAGGLYLVFLMPSNTRPWIILKLVLLSALFWVLLAIKQGVSVSPFT